jgi:SAF domain-containing protein
MRVAARIRLLLARSPWLYWAIVAALAGAAALLVMRAADGVDAARDAWGEPSLALVATRDIAPGAALDGATELRELPVPMVPAGALTDRGLGAVARQRIAAGEVVVEHDVAPNAAPRALIPDGWLAVAVSEPVASGAQVGDDVSVASGGVVLAVDGVVVGLAGEALLVAVPADEAAQVAHAAAGGDVAVLLKR